MLRRSWLRPTPKIPAAREKNLWYPGQMCAYQMRLFRLEPCRRYLCGICIERRPFLFKKKPGWMWTGLYFAEKVSHDIDKVSVVLSPFYSTYQQHLDAVKLWNYVSDNDLDCSSGPSCSPVDLILRKSTPKSFKIDRTFLRFLNNLIRCGTSFNPHNTQIRRHVRLCDLVKPDEHSSQLFSKHSKNITR